MVEQNRTEAEASETFAVTPLKGKQEQGSPLRLCALTRTKKPIDELIRFVLGPDDKIYPDISRRLPGRGVWITANRHSLEKATTSGVFSRSLKQHANVPGNLAEELDKLLAQRVMDSLALANKAGLVVAGYDKVFSLIGQSKAVALVHGSAAAESGRDRLDRKFVATTGADRAPDLIFDGLTIDQISLAMGRSNVVHAALKAGGAAARFVREARRLANFRSG